MTRLRIRASLLWFKESERPQISEVGRYGWIRVAGRRAVSKTKRCFVVVVVLLLLLFTGGTGCNKCFDSDKVNLGLTVQGIKECEFFRHGRSKEGNGQRSKLKLFLWDS